MEALRTDHIARSNHILELRLQVGVVHTGLQAPSQANGHTQRHTHTYGLAVLGLHARHLRMAKAGEHRGALLAGIGTKEGRVILLHILITGHAIEVEAGHASHMGSDLHRATVVRRSLSVPCHQVLLGHAVTRRFRVCSLACDVLRWLRGVSRICGPVGKLLRRDTRHGNLQAVSGLRQPYRTFSPHHADLRGGHTDTLRPPSGRCRHRGAQATGHRACVHFRSVWCQAKRWSPMGVHGHLSQACLRVAWHQHDAYAHKHSRRGGHSAPSAHTQADHACPQFAISRLNAATRHLLLDVAQQPLWGIAPGIPKELLCIVCPIPVHGLFRL